MIFHLFDQHLQHSAGHFYEYDKSLMQALAARGLKAALYGNRGYRGEEIGDLGVVPLFHQKTASKLFRGEPLTFPLNLSGGNARVYLDLRRLERTRFAGDDVLFFPSIGHHQIFGVLLWYWKTFPRGGRPALFLFLRYSPDHPFNCVDYPFPLNLAVRVMAPTRLLFWLAFRAMDALGLVRAFLVSDSHLLAAEFGAAARREVTVLPIPHMPEPLSDGRPRTREPVFCFLGTDRSEKGYDLLPEAIGSLLASGVKARFFVQSNGKKVETSVCRSRERLRSLGPRVSLIESTLDSGDYYALLHRADCVLLPYKPSCYPGRSSGVFAEALALGKAVVATRGTWMEKFVRETGCGVLMEAFTPRALANAIKAYLASRETFDENARLASRGWRAWHNADRFIDVLLSRMDRGEETRRETP